MSLYNKGLSSQRHQNRVIFHKENLPKIVKKISKGSIKKTYNLVGQKMSDQY